MGDGTKRYLGDSVYAQVQDGMILLTTEQGSLVTNQIFLDEYVLEELQKYAKKYVANEN